MANLLLPQDLTGPRSYFTDLDPEDQASDLGRVVPKLKLQLLTKQRVVVAASSLFHDIWFDLFRVFPDATAALEEGLIVPAIRNTFADVPDFFINKRYPAANRDFFVAHVRDFVTWDLKENTNWFRRHFANSIRDPKSIVRQHAKIASAQSEELLGQIDELVSEELPESRFLQRRHIEQASRKLSPESRAFLLDFANLLYRLSGARVVNSEGHFPQSNLTDIALAGNERLTSDESIFWDMYAEAAFTLLGSAIRLSKDRLETLSFNAILAIRKNLLDSQFVLEYDKLIGLAKSELGLADPDKVILRAEEISSIASRLKRSFETTLAAELSIPQTAEREKSLWQVANALALLAGPQGRFIIGVLSRLRSIPEITALVSPELARAMEVRMAWIRDFINTRIGWSKSQKQALLSAYRELITYGLR